MSPAQIYVVKSDGSEPSRATKPRNGFRFAESDPSWAPDGSQLVHWSYGYGIATVDGRGGEPMTLLMDFPAVAYGAKPVWSPDGRTIAFTRKNASLSREIWIVSASGGGGKLLIPDRFDAAWSPDGARIAFVSTPGR